MSYSSAGPKPYERASKSSHHHIINDPEVASMLSELHVPPRTDEADIKRSLVRFSPVESGIQHVVAVDGGYTEVPLREGFPSATIHFFQFGALHFRREDLKKLERSQHVSPEDMQKLKNIDRLKLSLPTKGARNKRFGSLRDSVRHTLYMFFQRETLGENSSLLDTLAWFLFHGYKGGGRADDEKEWLLSSNPYGLAGGVLLRESEMADNFTFRCPTSGNVIYLTDVFRVHERIEEETGAASVAGYVAGAIEHAILLHVVKNLLKKDASALKSVLFIMDRPTGWFGLTAPLHKPMLDLDGWLFSNQTLFLAGLEKSGAFVEHARELQPNIPAGSVLILSDRYIYKYISPGEEDAKRPYASTSYYGHKVIFKSTQGQMYVVSVPVRELKKAPKEEDLPHLREILTLVEELHCDMYENALLPVALANKLVSLSAHPSTQILKSFAQSTVSV